MDGLKEEQAVGEEDEKAEEKAEERGRGGGPWGRVQWAAESRGRFARLIQQRKTELIHTCIFTFIFFSPCAERNIN